MYCHSIGTTWGPHAGYLNTPGSHRQAPPWQTLPIRRERPPHRLARPRRAVAARRAGYRCHGGTPQRGAHRQAQAPLPRPRALQAHRTGWRCCRAGRPWRAARYCARRAQPPHPVPQAPPLARRRPCAPQVSAHTTPRRKSPRPRSPGQRSCRNRTSAGRGGGCTCQSRSAQRARSLGFRATHAQQRTAILARVMVACCPHAAHPASRLRSLTVMRRISSPSSSTSRPARLVPTPAQSLTASSACMAPMTPTTGPSTPASEQLWQLARGGAWTSKAQGQPRAAERSTRFRSERFAGEPMRSNAQHPA